MEQFDPLDLVSTDELIQALAKRHDGEDRGLILVSCLPGESKDITKLSTMSKVRVRIRGKQAILLERLNVVGNHGVSEFLKEISQ